MSLVKLFSGILPLLVFLGCSNPADNVPAAEVKPDSSSATGAATKPDSGGHTFAFGPDTGTVSFIGSKVTGSHEGGFRNVAGEFRVVDGKLAGSGNKVIIDTTSIWSDNDRLTGHLKSADFFDVAQFPTATFVSTSIDQKGANATVTGKLTLHGVTRQISFPAQIEVSKSAVNAKAEFSINRFDFDIKYPGRANDLIRNEVVLKIDVKAVPGRAPAPFKSAGG